MSTFFDEFTAPGTTATVNLVLAVTVTEQDQALNQSELAWQLSMEKGSAGFPNRAGNDSIAAAAVDGIVYSASNLNYNFPAGPYTIVVASGTKTITHTADGTKTITVSASYDGHNPLGVATIPATSMTLPKIDRNIVYLGFDGDYVLAEVCVGIDGAWVSAQPRVGVDDVWKLVTP